MRSQYYELMYIIPLKFAGESLKPSVDEVTKKLEDLGYKIHKNEEFGKLKFCYPIEHNHQGFYYVVEFEGNPKDVKELNDWLLLKKEVLRFIIVKKDPKLRSSYDFHMEQKAKGTYDRVDESTETKSEAVEVKKEKKEEPKPKVEKKEVKEEVKEEPVKEAKKVEKKPATKKEESKEGEESKVSLDDLDKKLDDILESEVPTI